MLILIGVIIGLLLGLTGAGGSVFAVPLLVLVIGMPMSDAVGISLGAVAATTLYASLRNWRGKAILWAPGLVLAATGALTAPLGKWLGTLVPDLWLLMGFSVLATIIALRMGISAWKSPEQARVVRASHFSTTANPGLLCNLSQTGQFELRPRCVSGLVLGGSLVGLLSGLFGVGGGFLIVPLLLALSPIRMAQAVNTSLLIITVVSGSGFVSHLLMHKTFAVWTCGLVGIGGVLGMMLGQAISHKIANAQLQLIFAVGLIVLSITTLWLHL